jgi:hypothetical protein
VKAAVEVRTEQELEHFAQGVLLRDENVEELSFNYEKIKVSYDMPAKFFSIIDRSIPVNAEVDTMGRVKVRYPWFSFLYKKLVSAADLEAELKAQIDVNAAANLQSDVQAAARHFQLLSNIMKVQHDTAVNAVANVK